VDPAYTSLVGAGMGYRPLATGYTPHRAFGTQGLPFTQGQFGSIVAMATGAKLQRMMGEVGMVPMGLEHDQNVYDRLMRQRFSMMQMQAMQMAAQNDRDEYVKTFRGGLSTFTGTPFGSEQRRAAYSLANAATSMSPVLAEMMPEFLDQLGGMKGSSAVLAKRMMEAGRYRIDPVSGRMGMTAESVGHMTNRLYSDLYSPETMPSMRGISAGNVGSMIQELQMRGMIATDAASSRFYGIRGDDPRYGTMRAIADMRQSSPNDLNRAALATGVNPHKPGGLTAEDLDKLQLDPRVADKLRSFDVDKIKRSVKSYVNVVSAMRDIFGDMGKPNAPMSELIAGIEALTMGSMSQLDPGRMSMMVRQTYNLAKQTGVTLDNVRMIQEHAANRAGQMGLEPTFAIQATQGGLAFGGAYRAQGHAAHTAWGAMSADQVQQLDTNLRVQAASSNAANRMAVTSRLAESMGGFDPNTDAGRYAAAVRAGATEFSTGSGGLRSVLMSDREFTQMMVGSKSANGMSVVSEGDVQTMLGQRDTNREYIERYGMANTVRRLQGTGELHPFVGHRMQETLAATFRDQLRRSGVDNVQANARAIGVASRISQKVTKRMFDMGTEEFADTGTRNRSIADFIQEEMEYDGATDILSGLQPSQRRDFLSKVADRFYGAANRAIGESAYRSFGNLQNVHRLTNRTTLDETDRQQMSARFTSEMQEALAPLGHGSLMARALEALKEVRPNDPNAMLSVLSESLGGVRIADINKALLPKFQELLSKRKTIEDLQEQIKEKTDPTERAALMERLDVARREINGQAVGLAKTGEQFGLFTADTVTHQDLSRAFSSTRALMTAQNDIIGVRGNFGAQVSERNLKEFRAGLGLEADPDNALIGKLTDEDRAAVIVESRSDDLRAIRRYIDGAKDAKLSAQQHANLKRYADGIRNSPIGQNMNNYAVYRMAYNRMLEDTTDIAPSELDKVTTELVQKDDDAAKAIIRARRRSIPIRATEKAVDAILKENPTLSREEAYDIANTRVRARRLGLDQSDVQDFITDEQVKDPSAFKGPFGEVEAIAELFDAKANSVYRDPKALQQAKERLDRFWASDEGIAFRQQTKTTYQDMETVAEKLVSAPQVANRLGTRAIEMSESIRSDQQRLRELAIYHTGGDLSRLMARDFTGIREKDPQKAVELVSKLNHEITSIQYRQRAYLAELMQGEGVQGRQFQLGDEDAVRRQVIEEQVAAGKMTRAKADEILASGLSSAKLLQYENARRQIGSEDSARRLLGIPANTRDLSDLQVISIAAARFGAGSEEEARLIYGADRWDKLKPSERAAILEKMQKGTGTIESAMALLGITKERLDAEGADGDLSKLVRSVSGGLMTDTHAMELVGEITPQQPGETDEQFEENKKKHAAKILDVRRGLFNPATIRSRMGLPEDKLPVDLQIKVDERREAIGNEAEAMRLLGLKPGQKLTEAQQDKLTRMVKDVSIARQIRPADEVALRDFEEKDKRVNTFATQKGISVANLTTRGKDFILDKAARGRLEEAKRKYDADARVIKDLNTSISQLEFRASNLDEANPQTATTRANIKASIAGAKAEIQRRQQGMKESESIIAADAKARGVTPAEYLGGKGWMTEDELTAFEATNAERRMALDKVEDIAAGLKVPVGDLAGATSVTNRIAEAQRQAAKRLAVNPVELTRDIMKAYGFGVGDKASQFEQEFASLLSGRVGLNMGERLLTSQRELASVATRRADGKPGNAGIEGMAKMYFDAIKSGKPADMINFRKAYGMYDQDKFDQVTGESNNQFEKFQRAIQFQQQTGILSFTGDKAQFRNKIQALSDATTEMKQSQEQSGQQTPTKIEMSGYVTLKGDQLDLAGAWGGGRAYIPGGLT